jgi:carbamoyl-phosphate synthase small subunit
LGTWAKEQNIPGIYGIDTRRLTQKLRDNGVMLGKIVTGSKDIKIENPNLRNLVAEASIDKVKIHKPKPSSNTQNPAFIGLLNCGAKKSIVRNLQNRGATVYELPWNYDPFEAKLKLDGLMISNGPGDPKMAKATIAIIRKSLNKKLPTFGVCLGNQLLALAAGGDTYKLKFGHRAQNQPTIEVKSKRCYITTQNHGFSVNEAKMPSGFTRWFYNANDDTNEGIIHKTLPFFAVQFHPEATPGPTDTQWLFDYFLNVVKKNKSSFVLDRIDKS